MSTDRLLIGLQERISESDAKPLSAQAVPAQQDNWLIATARQCAEDCNNWPEWRKQAVINAMQQPSPAVAVPYICVDQLRHAVADAFNAGHEQGRKNPNQKDEGLGIAVTMREMYVSSVDQILTAPSPRITEQDLNAAVAAELLCIANSVEIADGQTIERQNALCYAANLIRAHIKNMPKDGLLSDRVTEQDAREIASHFIQWFNYFDDRRHATISKWIDEEGRALLNKLNAKPEIVGGK